MCADFGCGFNRLALGFGPLGAVSLATALMSTDLPGHVACSLDSESSCSIPSIFAVEIQPFCYKMVLQSISVWDTRTQHVTIFCNNLCMLDSDIQTLYSSIMRGGGGRLTLAVG